MKQPSKALMRAIRRAVADAAVAFLTQLAEEAADHFIRKPIKTKKLAPKQLESEN